MFFNCLNARTDIAQKPSSFQKHWISSKVFISRQWGGGMVGLMYITQCTNCALYIVQCTLYTVQCTALQDEFLAPFRRRIQLVRNRLICVFQITNGGINVFRPIPLPPIISFDPAQGRVYWIRVLTQCLGKVSLFLDVSEGNTI